MANLTPAPIWGDIYQLSDDEIAVGGPGGIMNAQAQSLLNRFAYLGSDTGTDKIRGQWASGPANLNVLGTSDGMGMLSFLQATAGAQVQTLQSRLSLSVSLWDFMSSAMRADVVAGTALVDTSPAFVSALASGKPVHVPTGAGWIYRIGQTISLPSGTYLHSDGAKLRLASGVNNHVLRIASGASGVIIKGLELDCNKAGNTVGQGIASSGTGPVDVLIEDCRILNAKNSGVYLSGVGLSRVTVRGCRVSGCDDAGITATDISLFKFHDNHSWLNGTHGVGLIGTGSKGVISNNVCWDNGQINNGADDLTGYNDSIFDVAWVNNSSSGSRNNGIHVAGSRIVVAGNTVENSLFHGIVVQSAGGATSDDVTVTGNTITSAGYNGIWLEDCTDTAVVGNAISTCGFNPVGTGGRNGILLDDCSSITISANSIRGNAQAAIRLQNVADSIINANRCRSNQVHGLHLANATGCVFNSNIIKGNTGWGVFNAGEGDNIFTSNQIRSNTVGQIQPMAITTMVENNQFGVSRTVASAATLTLYPGGRYFYVTGTTNITSITASYTERVVTLVFDGVLTVTDGGNLRLNGNYVTAFQRSITLVSDGTNWTEIARSPNT